ISTFVMRCVVSKALLSLAIPKNPTKMVRPRIVINAARSLVLSLRLLNHCIARFFPLSTGRRRRVEPQQVSLQSHTVHHPGHSSAPLAAAVGRKGREPEVPQASGEAVID